MIISRGKSMGTKSDHLNLRVDLMQVLHMEHDSGMGRKAAGGHSADKIMPYLIKSYFPESTLPTE
jgi:hypothetical protein